MSAVMPNETVPAGDDALVVSVDNRHCHLYGICQQEAPDVFGLDVDGRLRYDAHPAPTDTAAVRQAARFCPMQAITVSQVRK